MTGPTLDDRAQPGSLDPDRAHGILNSLLAELPGVVYRCRNDRNRTMLGVTANVERLTGYAPSELIGTDSSSLAELIHAEDRERVRAHVQAGVDEGAPFRSTYRIRTSDGEERWVLEQGRAVEEDGEVVLTGYIQDVTGPCVRRLAESQEEMVRTRRHAERLGLLQAVTSIANRENRLEDGLRTALPLICEALDFAVGHVLFVGTDGSRELRPSSIWHPDEGVEGVTGLREAPEGEGREPGRGLAGRALESGRAEWTDDEKAEPHLSPEDDLDRLPLRSGVAVPVISGKRTVAVLEFYVTERRSPDPEIGRLLEQIGVQLGRVWERERGTRERMEAERRLRQLAENVDAMFWLSTPEGEPLYVSSGFGALTGLDETIHDWREYLRLIHPDDRERMEALFSNPDRAPYEVEYRIVRPDSDVRWIRQKAFPIRDEEGRIHQVGGVADDVTDSRRIRERLARILDSLTEGVTILDRGGRITYANEAAGRLTPFSPSELLELTYDSAEWRITHRDGTPMDPEELPAARALESGEPVRNELIVVHGPGEDDARILSVNAVPFAPGRDQVEEVIVSFTDVTARERVSRELRESEERFRQIAERIDTVFWISSPDKGEMEYISPGYAEIWGRPPGELYEDSTRWLEHIHPDDRERVRDALPGQVEGTYEEEYRVVRPDGEVRWIWDRAFPIRNESGDVHRLIGIAEDITERKAAEEELRRAEEHYRALIENSADVIAILDHDLVTRWVSPSVEEMLGYTPEEIVSTKGSLRFHPDDREEALRELQKLRERPGDILLHTVRMIAKDGSVRHVEARAQNLLDEPSVSGLVVNAHDITERTELEAQLRQSQKMEAVGRLAGGIAHDFNNLLTVIRSQADLVLMDLSAGSDLAEEIEVVQDAANRAAELTRQLLAFSRVQMLRPKLVSVNEILRNMEQLLIRVLGEDVRIETELADDLPPIRVDPGQLEQVLMNLAVNARDAMPGGGILTLATMEEELGLREAAAVPGLGTNTSVRLTVSDTGVGMDEDTLARIFEPFFTTKEAQGGTGLGLAVSYGIVKQSGGTIHAESTPGEGSAFTLRFPPAEGSRDTGESGTPKEVDRERTGGTVLVVEDDLNVRRVTGRILERAGFRVRTAEDAETGLRLLEEEDVEPDLVLTDLVLPGTGGRELVERVRERFPGLRLVVMSGYAEGSPGARGDLPEEVGFIQKPFTPEGLVEVIGKRLAVE